MTRYDIARMCGYNSVEEYEEAEKRKHEIFTESLKRQKPYVEKEPVKIQPVEHGRWEDCEIRGSLAMRCSVCGNDSGVLYNYAYCPNCGARMDGDAE